MPQLQLPLRIRAAGARQKRQGRVAVLGRASNPNCAHSAWSIYCNCNTNSSDHGCAIHVVDEQSAKDTNQLKDRRPCDVVGPRASPSVRPSPLPHYSRCGYRTRVDDPWLFNHGRRRPRLLDLKSRLLGGGPAAPASDIEMTHRSTRENSMAGAA